MSNNSLKQKYFFKYQDEERWKDIAQEFQGVRVLKVDGMGDVGDATNVYAEQWMESQEEDFLITGESGNIIRSNVDISMTVIISRRYTYPFTFDEMEMYRHFVETLLCKDFYLASIYTGLQAHVVCNKSFKPTTMKLHRDNDSYILVTIPLHTLDAARSVKKPCQCQTGNNS